MAESPPSPRIKDPKSVRVWAEVGISMPISNESGAPWIKFSFGHERIAPNDSVETIKKYETLIYEACEAVVEKRVKQIRRMIKQI